MNWCYHCGRIVDEEDDMVTVPEKDRLCGLCEDERDEARRDDAADRKRDERWADSWDKR